MKTSSSIRIRIFILPLNKTITKTPPRFKTFSSDIINNQKTKPIIKNETDNGVLNDYDPDTHSAMRGFGFNSTTIKIKSGQDILNYKNSTISINQNTIFDKTQECKNYTELSKFRDKSESTKRNTKEELLFLLKKLEKLEKCLGTTLGGTQEQIHRELVILRYMYKLNCKMHSIISEHSQTCERNTSVVGGGYVSSNHSVLHNTTKDSSIDNKNIENDEISWQIKEQIVKVVNQGLEKLLKVLIEKENIDGVIQVLTETLKLQGEMYDKNINLMTLELYDTEVDEYRYVEKILQLLLVNKEKPRIKGQVFEYLYYSHTEYFGYLNFKIIEQMLYGLYREKRYEEIINWCFGLTEKQLVEPVIKIILMALGEIGKLKIKSLKMFNGGSRHDSKIRIRQRNKPVFIDRNSHHYPLLKQVQLRNLRIDDSKNVYRHQNKQNVTAKRPTNMGTLWQCNLSPNSLVRELIHILSRFSNIHNNGSETLVVKTMNLYLYAYYFTLPSNSSEYTIFDPRRLFRLFNQTFGLIPDATSLNTILGCLITRNSMDVRPKTIFEMMKRGYGKFPLYHSPINPSGDQEGSYQHTHSLSTRLKLSQKSVLLLPRPDSVTYGIIIGYHLTNSQPKDALKLLEEMEANGLIPHRKTVGLIISYLVDNSHLHLAIKLWLSYCHLITNLRRDTLEEPQLRQTTSVSGGRSSGVVDFKQYSRTLLSLYAMPKLISGCLSSKSTLVFGGDTCVFITDEEIHQPISKLMSANMETNETSDPHSTLNVPVINSCGKEVLFASFYSKFQNWKSAIKIFLYSQENYPKLFATRNGETCTKVLNSLMSFYFNLHIDCVDKLYLDNSNDFDSDSRAALLREFECSKSIDLILSCYKNGSNPNSDTYSIIMKYVTFLARKLNSPHSSNSLALGVNLLDKISQSLLNSCNPTTPTKPTLPSYYISQDSNYINIAPRINIHSVLYHPPDISILADDPKYQLGYLPAKTTLDSHQPGATTVRQLSEFSGILLAHMLNSRLVPDINTLVLFIPAILASNSNFGTAISLWHLTTELNPKLSKKLSHGGFESTNPDMNGTSASERGNSKAPKSNSALVSFKLSLLQKSSSWSSRSNVRSWLDYVGINNS